MPEAPPCTSMSRPFGMLRQGTMTFGPGQPRAALGPKALFASRTRKQTETPKHHREPASPRHVIRADRSACRPWVPSSPSPHKRRRRLRGSVPPAQRLSLISNKCLQLLTSFKRPLAGRRAAVCGEQVWWLTLWPSVL